MTLSAVVEGFWDTLLRHVSTEEATEIMIDLRNNVIGKQTSLVDFSTTAEKISICKKCSNLEEYSHRIASWNVINPKLLIVLERPKIGPEASRAVLEALSNSGFDKSTASLTYLLRCFNKNYTSTNKNNCFPHLEDEISSLNPDLIVACGKTVADYILGPIDTLSHARGNIYKVGNYPVLVTYSPLYVTSQSSNQNLLDNFYTDFQMAAKLCSIRKQDDE